MAEEKNPTECFVCQGHLFQIEDSQFGCDSCKRVWENHHGEWTSQMRKVRILKMPEMGDNIDDILKPLPPQE